MIHLMLNDLCRPAGKVFGMRFHFKRLELHLNGFIAFTLTWGAEKRQTAFLGFIDAGACDNLGIKHYGVCRSSSALIEKSDDPLRNPIFLYILCSCANRLILAI